MIPILVAITVVASTLVANVFYPIPITDQSKHVSVETPVNGGKPHGK
jgi:hypothetical protein